MKYIIWESKSMILDAYLQKMGYATHKCNIIFIPNKMELLR